MANYYTGTGGSDSTGDGTSHATRWLTIQKAIDSMTTGQRNQLNCTGSETLSAALDFTTRPYAPSESNYLILKGYGGAFSLDGGGAEIVTGDTVDGLYFQNFKFTNWGSGQCFSLDNYCGFAECEFDGEGSRAEIVDMDVNCYFVRNKVHSMAQNGHICRFAGGSKIIDNYFHVVSMASGNVVIQCTGTECSVERNIVSIKAMASSGCHAIAGTDGTLIVGNSIFNQSSVQGTGIKTVGARAVRNNIVGSFSVGVEASSQIKYYAGNKFYNCTTPESLTEITVFDLGGNDTALGSNPFTTTGSTDHNDDDFTPVSAVHATGRPVEFYDPGGAFGTRNMSYIDPGALQHEDAGGGGGGLTQRQTIIQNIGTY